MKKRNADDANHGEKKTYFSPKTYLKFFTLFNKIYLILYLKSHYAKI